MIQLQLTKKYKIVSLSLAYNHTFPSHNHLYNNSLQVYFKIIDLARNVHLYCIVHKCCKEILKSCKKSSTVITLFWYKLCWGIVYCLPLLVIVPYMKTMATVLLKLYIISNSSKVSPYSNGLIFCSIWIQSIKKDMCVQFLFAWTDTKTHCIIFVYI